MEDEKSSVGSKRKLDENVDAERQAKKKKRRQDRKEQKQALSEQKHAMEVDEILAKIPNENVADLKSFDETLLSSQTNQATTQPGQAELGKVETNGASKEKKSHTPRKDRQRKPKSESKNASKDLVPPVNHTEGVATNKAQALSARKEAAEQTKITPLLKPTIAAEDKVTREELMQQKKKDRRERKKLRDKSSNDPTNMQPHDHTNDTAGSQGHTLKLQKKEQNTSRGELWSVSEPIGGSYIDSQPSITKDQKYIIVATEAAAHVYSMSNSVLTQSLANGSSGRTVAYCLSSVDDNVVYVATDKFHVLKWNFLNGKRLGRWAINGATYGIQSTQLDQTADDTLFIIDKSNKGWHIVAHRFGTTADPAKTELVTLVELQKPIRSLKVVGNGRIVVAITSDGLLLGKATSAPGNDLKALKYSWHQIKCAETPTCFDVQVRSVSLTAAQGKNVSQQPVDVVVGGFRGCLYLFRDIVSRFDKMPTTQNKSDAQRAPAVEMHWHRQAVGSVAWSRDGNYVISGGKETVLVIWQLDTGLKQFLPHLESAIQSIVVSPNGASYAVRLGDNSIMVLSTSELTPTANVVGLQTMNHISGVSSPLVEIENVARDLVAEPYRDIACAINHTNPSRLLVAVPSSQSDGAGALSAPYLQTFDIMSSRHVARQALTRLNATSLNIGPDGNKILEPNVKFMQMSHDGRWLATVDEWSTPKQDVKDLMTNGHTEETVQTHDVQLKFWSWNGDTQEWMLNTRFAVPHSKEDSPACERILDMAADTSSTRFATLGTDSKIRVWRARMRAITEQSAQGREKVDPSSQKRIETWWAMDYSIALPTSLSAEHDEHVSVRRGKLAFSGDGSILAVYQRFDNDDRKGRDVLHFIDTEHRQIQQSRADLYQGQGIHDFAFLERYLICVGREKIAVWDTTTFGLIMESSIPLVSSTTQSSENTRMQFTRESPPFTRLAIDAKSNTFAVAAPELTNRVKHSKVNPIVNYSTRLYVFSPSTLSKVLFETKLPYAALALLPAGGRGNVDIATQATPLSTKGYVLLDAGACIRLIRPDYARTRMPLINGLEVVPSVSSTSLVGLEQETNGQVMDIDDGSANGVDEEAWSTAFAETEDKRPVVRTQELANILDYPSHAMPSMTEMFKSVLSLYAGKA